MPNEREYLNNSSPAAAGSKSQDAEATGSGSGAQPGPIPSIALPKGGGAIRGIGEKFAANPVTGTASLTIPISTSPGRSGFGPQLALSYDSGAGNGPFGFGWNLSLPAITRKTDKGLPEYKDAEESDVFILSGAEDLVPVLLETGGKWEPDSAVRLVDGMDYCIERYRPRIEGLFARIERWTCLQTGEIHWRSITRDNVTTLYGKDNNSRIFDPADPNPKHPKRVFSWLICQSYDDKGNAIAYEYKEENSDDVDLSQAHERNRSAPGRSANRYLKHIKYGNLTSRLIQPDLSQASWMFEVVLDYGEHDDEQSRPADARAWFCRNDPFSSYRAGFEVRSYRLCQRILMFHHFPEEEEVGQDCLVRSTDFIYRDIRHNPADQKKGHPIAAFIAAVTQNGYKRQAAGGYLKKSLPPVEFEYSEPIIQHEIREVDRKSLENLPYGLDGSNYRWVDLDGEGLSGILTEQANAWLYKPNLGQGRFGPLEPVIPRPSLADLRSGHQELIDLAGDGQLDFVEFSGSTPGFYERTPDQNWERFKHFISLPNISWNDPNLRFVDLTGDGHADILIAHDEVFTWYPSLGEDGFGPSRRTYQSLEQQRGARIVFADSTESVYLGDMSGDGLPDLVRVRNGEVCYWPSLGYGRFGPQVTMDNGPWFDYAEHFDQKRVRLADIDGSGTNDIIYLGRDSVRIYFNQSGNSFSEPQRLKEFPRVDNLASVTTVDLLGNGTACLVWSSPLPGDSRRPMRYIDLMGGQKPHLLIAAINNLGAETHVHYAASTKFYLGDKLQNKPWLTKLPFPVHVVERVETYDRISRNRFVTKYSYHHGYFDGVEREFRGFGMVEQQDTEEFAALNDSPTFPTGDNIDEASHVPPVLTRTWFHTGVYLGRDHVSDFFAGLLGDRDVGEYYREPGLNDAQARQLLLDDTLLPEGLTDEEEREACRALKGLMLRQEVYALDGTPKQGHPYTVAEQNFSVRLDQPCGSNRHAVFFTHARETIKFHYERNPADPRIQHALTLEVDGYGNVLKEASIGYDRRITIGVVDAQRRVQQVPNPGLAGLTASDQAKQTTALVTYTENLFTNAIEVADTHRNPLPCEALTYELTGFPRTGPAGRLRAADMVEPDPNAVGRLRHKFTDQVAYEAEATVNPCRRPIEWLRTLYRRDDLNNLLPLGELHPLGLPGESYKLAFTPGLLAQVFERPVEGQPPEVLLPDPSSLLGGQAGNQGGYLRSQILKADGRFPAQDADDNWWTPSGQSFFSTNPADPAATELAQARQHFFLPRRYRDPFGQDTLVDFDANDLLIVRTRDAMGNGMTVDVSDYRVLQPRVASDPNRNQTEVAFDTLGMVVGTAVMGKPLPAPVEGDSLTGFVTDLTQAQLDTFFDSPDPHADAQTLLQSATTRNIYDFDCFRRTQQANPNDPSQWKPVYAATLARETHVAATPPPRGLKIQISFSYSDGYGREIQKKIQAERGMVAEGGTVIDPRWVGTGWTIFNNKGKPVRQYEPFFSAPHRFEFGVMVGVSPLLFYDSAGRVIATLHPNHTFEKVVFDPWQRITYDVNDTCAPRNTQTGDPRTDPDIRGHVARYFAGLPATRPAPAWQTWHEQRIGGALGPNEQVAATRAAAHADTPTSAHFDTLGRPFLTVARNRVVCAGHDLDGTEDRFFARVELDIEGNQRVVGDAIQQAGDSLGRIVMRYAYDMLGNRIRQLSMEAGARWMLNDVAGKPIRAWDSRGHNFTTTYDRLRRQVEQGVRGTTVASDPRTVSRDILVERIEYGESQAGAEALNLRTRIYRHFDSAGIATNARLDANGNPLLAYDFKGNPLRSTRRFISDYTAIPDWQLNPSLDAETFEGATSYDALNRPIQSIAPHSSLARTKRNIIQPVFNEANLLERVDVWLDRENEPVALLDPAAEATSAVGVANIDYDARGQRQRINYKNGAGAFYQYDPLTFRLINLYTRRGAAFTEDCDNSDPPPPAIAAPDKPPHGKACGLQNLRYTYDPAGNITHIQDEAQQAIYFRNKRVEPSNDYTYDALFRLIQATGREHLGQIGPALNPPTAPDAFNAFHARLDHPGDGNAMGTYIERYVYDGVGNFLQMQHRGSDPAHAGWTRAYDYLEPSLIEDGVGGTLLKTGNRLTRTTLNPSGANPQPEPYEHDSHGNMVRMPHLGVGLPEPNMHWDYRDQLRQTDLGGGGVAHYVYDASGQRVRKVWEKSPGLIEERIYIGGFEIFRKHNGSIGANTATLERETLHVMDDKQRVALVETRTLDTLGNDRAPALLIRYQLGNHLTSACLELDDQAQIISYEEYAPYGSSMYQAVRSLTEMPRRYRYTGKERDEETGLSYHGARYYACWLARWSSADPEQLTDGPNLYQFARDNPIVLMDPDGNQAAPAPLDPETIIIAATALQRAAQVWGTAGIITGGAVAAAPVAAPVVAAPLAAPVGGLAAAPAAFMVAAQVAAAAAMALATYLYMRRAGSIARYGNPYGMPGRDIAFPVLREVQRLRFDPYPLPEPAPDRDEQPRPRPGRVYVTYTKFNSQTGRYYSGRTSAPIDLNLPWRPQAEMAVRLRDANHHIDEQDEPTNPSFGPAVLDQFSVGYAVEYKQRYRDVGYLAIRGREQQLIDYHGAQRAAHLGIDNFNGGAQSDTNPGTPLTENNFRGVSKDNPLGEVFHQAANLVFRGELAPYTGDRNRLAPAP